MTLLEMVYLTTFAIATAIQHGEVNIDSRNNITPLPLPQPCPAGPCRWCHDVNHVICSAHGEGIAGTMAGHGETGKTNGKPKGKLMGKQRETQREKHKTTHRENKGKHKVLVYGEGTLISFVVYFKEI